jgi:hypothetical protein
MDDYQEPLTSFVKHQGRPEESVLNNFDFTLIEEEDPALCTVLEPEPIKAYELLFDREAPIETRIYDPSRKGKVEVGPLQAIRVKVLKLVSELSCLTA